MILATVIDTDKKTLKSVKDFAEEYGFDVNFKYQADSFQSGFKVLTQNPHPDVLFLNYELIGGDGFELLELIHNQQFKVVLLSELTDPGVLIEAINGDIFYFLKKPFEGKNLIGCFEKIQQKLQCIPESSPVLFPIETIENKSENQERCIRIKTRLGQENISHCIKLKDIILCKGEGNYTTFHLKNGKKLTSDGNLGNQFEILQSFDFYKPHRSYIINLLHVKSYDNSREGTIFMTNKLTAKYSRNKKEEFEGKLNAITRMIN